MINGKKAEENDWESLQLPKLEDWVNLEGKLVKNSARFGLHTNMLIGESKDQKYKLFRHEWVSRDPREGFRERAFGYRGSEHTYIIECPMGKLRFKTRDLEPAGNDLLNSGGWFIHPIIYEDLSHTQSIVYDYKNNKKGWYCKQIVEHLIGLHAGGTFRVKFYPSKGWIERKLDALAEKAFCFIARLLSSRR